MIQHQQQHGLGATNGSSSGPGFFTGLAMGLVAGGVLGVLLVKGLEMESQRSSKLAARRRAGYAY